MSDTTRNSGEDSTADSSPRLSKLSPPDPNYTYATLIERMGGAGVDLIFLHIILIPLSTPAADLSFNFGHAGPAAIFTGFYFLCLLLFMHFKGLTPGGVPLRFRVVDAEMRFPSWGRCFRRLAPYVVIELGSLWYLHVAIQNFAASGDPYEFENLRSIIRDHGGLWRGLVAALNSYVIVDILFIVSSRRNQSLSDKLAGTFAVARSA